MKILIISLVLLLMTGCMTMFRGTVNEYCNSHIERYANYNQCYQEESDYRAHVRNSMSHTGDGLQTNRSY